MPRSERIQLVWTLVAMAAVAAFFTIMCIAPAVAFGIIVALVLAPSAIGLLLLMIGYLP